MEGDGAWGLGCVAYERTLFALKDATKSHTWLTVTQDPEKPLRFAFAIGHVPFRLYRGDPGEPPSKYLSTSYVELHERQLALDLGVDVPVEGFLRVAIETDATGRASEISIVEIDENRQITGVYSVPLGRTTSKVTPMATFTRMEVPVVDLAPPMIELAQPEEELLRRPKAQNE